MPSWAGFVQQSRFFAQIDLISSIFRRFIAAIHTTFGGGFVAQVGR
jgi:hypothetical protein